MTDQYDAVIIGGGMVGATLACGLGDSDLRIAVIEELRPEGFAADQLPDLRVSALSIASCNILKTIGAWNGVLLRRLCPFRRMRVWESTGETLFRSDDIDEAVLGYIVENRVVQLALLDRISHFGNVDLFCPERTSLIEYSPDRSRVRLEDGRTFSTRLLIAADGGHSKVRQAAAMGVSSWDYRQHALVLTVETAYGQQDITWQRFTPAGPQAFLPLPGSHASLVWYNSPEEVRRLQGQASDALLRQLEQAFPNCLGEVTRLIAKGSFPLRLQHALGYVQSGIALVGDAAHMIHPLAGQGVNIGLLDAAALAQVLIAAQEKRQDIGSVKVLREYERMRRNQNLLMMTAMDAFYRVFGTSHFPLKLIRNFGLSLAERVPPARKLVMRYAMGLHGNLPRLARGEAIVG
jgi:2-octaprenyl-3-methyl-6-methoxy-1,4-benzoquinol hydroxylase